MKRVWQEQAHSNTQESVRKLIDLYEVCEKPVKADE
jgi:hypothetical protein